MARSSAKNETELVDLDGTEQIVILAGKELFLQHEYTERILEAVRSRHGEVDLFRFSGGEASPAEVLDECRSFGLIASHKIVIVDEAESMIKKETRKIFERYAENPSEGATLVLRSGNWHKGKLDTLVSKVGAVVSCKPLDPIKGEGVAIRWVSRRAREKHGLKIDQRAAALLVERAGVDRGRLSSDLEKLAAGCSTDTIGVKQVDLLVGTTRLLEPWPLQERLLSGSAESAISYIRTTIATSPRGVEIPLIFAASGLARDLHACAIAQKMRVGIKETARRLEKKSDWQLKEVFPAAQRLSPRQTGELLQACIQADAASKSGLGNARRSLEVLAVRYAQVMRPSR